MTSRSNLCWLPGQPSKSFRPSMNLLHMSSVSTRLNGSPRLCPTRNLLNSLKRIRNSWHPVYLVLHDEAQVLNREGKTPDTFVYVHALRYLSPRVCCVLFFNVRIVKS